MFGMATDRRLKEDTALKKKYHKTWEEHLVGMVSQRQRRKLSVVRSTEPNTI